MKKTLLIFLSLLVLSSLACKLLASPPETPLPPTSTEVKAISGIPQKATALLPTGAAPAQTESVATPAPPTGIISDNSIVWNAIGPENENIRALALDPLARTTLYAGADGGLFKSSDSGATWAAANTGMENLSVQALAIDLTVSGDTAAPATLYAGTDEGAFMSNDSGANWTAADAGMEGLSVQALAIDPTSPTTLFAGTDSGVFMSNDGGESWAITGADLEGLSVLTLAIDPATPTTLYAGTNEGVFKSSDGGESWRAANAGLASGTVTALAIHPLETSTLYAGTYGSGIYQSIDGGDNWHAANTELAFAHVLALAIDPQTPDILYAGATGGISRSADGGQNWQAINTGLAHSVVQALAIDPSTTSTLYAGTGNGVYTNQARQVALALPSPSPTTGLAEQDAPPSPTPSITATAAATASPTTRLSTTPTASTSPTAGLSTSTPTRSPTVRSTTASTTAPSATLRPTTPVVLPSATQRIPTATPTRSPTPSAWQTAMDEYARDNLDNLPLSGLTLAIRRQGGPDWVRAYGLANREQSISAATDTVYQIGSLSMSFTAAAVMQLVEKGKLSLTAPISQYLDGLPVDLENLTLHQLLSHTSHIYDTADTYDAFLGDQVFTSETLLQELVPTFGVDASSDYPASLSYGNYILAGLIIEKVSGLSYATYMSQNVFPSAGLQHTSYCLPQPAQTARTYYLPGTGFALYDVNISAVFAAGGLCSTASDMLLWVDALSSAKVVRADSYQKMITPVEVLEGFSLAYGYGLYVQQDQNGLQIVSFGDENGSASALVAYPTKGLIVALLSNTSYSGDELLQGIWGNLPILMP